MTCGRGARRGQPRTNFGSLQDDQLTSDNPTYERVYQLAADLLTTHGVDFPFVRLEEAAGLGSGGLRHYFRDMRSLVATFTADEFEQVNYFEPDEGMPRDPAPMLIGWCVHMACWLAGISGRAKMVSRAYGDQASPIHAVTMDIVEATGPYVRAAADAGALSTRVEGGEIVLFILAAASMSEDMHGVSPAPPESLRTATAERFIRLMLHGVLTPTS